MITLTRERFIPVPQCGNSEPSPTQLTPRLGVSGSVKRPDIENIMRQGQLTSPGKNGKAIYSVLVSVLNPPLSAV